MQKNPIDAYDRFFSGDTEAAGALIAVYSDSLVRFAYRYLKDADLAEDAAEDAFVVLFLKKRHFSMEGQLRTYLYRTVRNRAIDLLRRQAREVSLDDVEGVLSEIEDVGSDPQAEFLREERNRAIRRCISALPTQYREVLVLCYFERLEPDAIATVMRQSKKQVYNLLTRARTSLKERLIQEGITNEIL